MSGRPWRSSDGWEFLLRHVRSDAELRGGSSLLVSCLIAEASESEYSYLQHWQNGYLASWEGADGFGHDLLVARHLEDEDLVWSSDTPANGLARDRFRTSSTPDWCVYPPRPFGCVAVGEPSDAVLTVRVTLRDHFFGTQEIGLQRLHDGTWAECRGRPSERLQLPAEDLALELSRRDWTRLATGRASFVQVADRVKIDGDALILGAMQSGLATAHNLQASVGMWPAVLLYEEYIAIIAALDAEELRRVMNSQRR